MYINIKMSKWTEFATKFYNDKKKNNKDYKFSQALKEASKEYKGGKQEGGDKVCENGVTVRDDEECPESKSTPESTIAPPESKSTPESTIAPPESTFGGKRRKSARKSGRKSRKARKSRKSRK
jgi:hypothetical protein